MHVVPLRTKSPEETADAIDQVLTEIGHSRSVIVDPGGEFEKGFPGGVEISWNTNDRQPNTCGFC